MQIIFGGAFMCFYQKCLIEEKNRNTVDHTCPVDAILILANAQATNSIVVLHPLFEDGFHLRLHLGPRAARVKTFATRFGRVLLWCW